MAVMVVGKWDDIAPGDQNGRAKMSEFFGGKAIELPLRDPMTLIVPAAKAMTDTERRALWTFLTSLPPYGVND
jgi:hypothetical protein